MNRYQLILFDLDGTLTDSKPGIVNSILYALEKMGIREEDQSRLESFIGPPLLETFRVSYGLAEEEAVRAVEYYREYFRAKGMFENSLYPGISQLLAALQQERKKMAIAPSKPTVFAKHIVRHFAIDGYFELVAGSHLDNTRGEKGEIINFVLEQFPFCPKSACVMIGDRKHDIIGARLSGIDSIGVTYGYGSAEELRLENPTRMVSHPDELLALLSHS